MENVEQPKRIVAVFYVAAAVIVGIFLTRVLGTIFNTAGINDPPVDVGFVQLPSVSAIIGYASALVIAVVVWRIPKTQQVSLDVALELRRVTWPSWRETRAATIAVIVASLIAAALLGLFDVLWQFLTDKLQNPSL